MKLQLFTDDNNNYDFINDNNKYHGYFLRYDASNQNYIFKGFWRNNTEVGKWKEIYHFKYYL